MNSPGPVMREAKSPAENAEPVWTGRQLSPLIMQLIRLCFEVPRAGLGAGAGTQIPRTGFGVGFGSALADIFQTESLCILAERLSQWEIGLPLRRDCHNLPLNA